MLGVRGDSSTWLWKFAKLNKNKGHCSALFLISIIIAVSCIQNGYAGNVQNETIGNVDSTTPYDDEYSDSSDSHSESNVTSWRDRNWRRQDNSKIAQVVVYFSVILIALAGVLIKYFVTQYETSQIKAQEQLDYQRLQNA